MNFNIDNIVTILTCIISGIFGYNISKISFKNPYKLKILEKTFYKVYLPLFKKFEPNLYKTISTDVALDYISFFNLLKNRYYELIDSNLVNAFQIFENDILRKTDFYNSFETVCQILEKLFETTRKKLFLPNRRLAYKINNEQFPRGFRNMTKYIIERFCRFLGFILIFSIIYYIISAFVSFIEYIKTIL